MDIQGIPIILIFAAALVLAGLSMWWHFTRAQTMLRDWAERNEIGRAHV